MDIKQNEETIVIDREKKKKNSIKQQPKSLNHADIIIDSMKSQNEGNQTGYYEPIEIGITMPLEYFPLHIHANEKVLPFLFTNQNNQYTCQICQRIVDITIINDNEMGTVVSLTDPNFVTILCQTCMTKYRNNFINKNAD